MLDSRDSAAGFTVIEIMLGVAILGIVAGLAYPAYQQYRERVKVAQAIYDIKEIDTRIQLYFTDNRAYPASLAEVGKDGVIDPWGNAYRYTNLQTANQGAARKNKNLVPINSDFDLFSMGKDGDSRGPLNARPSRDDIVRANDGRFVGLASEYDP